MCFMHKYVQLKKIRRKIEREREMKAYAREQCLHVISQLNSSLIGTISKEFLWVYIFTYECMCKIMLLYTVEQCCLIEILK